MLSPHPFSSASPELKKGLSAANSAALWQRFLFCERTGRKAPFQGAPRMVFGRLRGKLFKGRPEQAATVLDLRAGLKNSQPEEKF
jgi:hypothetical protein